MRRHAVVALAALVGTAGCQPGGRADSQGDSGQSGDEVGGPGTDTVGESGSDSANDSAETETTSDEGESESETGDDGDPPEPIDPGYPDFPPTISTLSITIRTADVEYAGTDDGHLSLCLNADACFLLDTPGTAAQNTPWPNDFQQGEVDTFHFEGVDLPRSDVDRVELRTSDGENAFRPACIAVRFDGEPVHCNDDLDVQIGNTGSELMSFSDPDGLHNACASCYPEVLAGGPMLGAVRDDSARLWVRSDATRRVTVLVAPEDAPEDERVAAYVYPAPTEDFVGEVVLDDLDPNTAYRYRFGVDGRGTSEGATFFSAPSGGGQLTRIAMGSCSREYPAPIFAEIADAEPDLLLHLGDNHYANANYAGNTDAQRLAILRWHYRRSLMQEQRATLAATIPSLAVWDDHDFVGDNTTAADPGRLAALRAFDEYWANSELGTDDTLGTFSVEHYGDIDLFLLDDRFHRSEEGEADGSILGPEQEAWLFDELAASTAVFKFVVSGSLFSLAGESWTDFPARRAALFDFMADQGISGVVLLSGDVHRSLFRRLPRQNGYAIPELVSSPLNNGNSTCKVDPNAEEIACHDTGNYFVTLDVDTMADDPSIVASIIDEAGQPQSSLTVHLSELE